MPYEAEQTGQITFPGHPVSTSLKVHEFENGEPLCGAPLRSWNGKRASYTGQGRGVVDCRRCERARSTAEDVR